MGTSASANAGIPASGRPARRNFASASSSYVQMREVIAGACSPPLASPPWQATHRLSYCRRPVEVFWAAAGIDSARLPRHRTNPEGGIAVRLTLDPPLIQWGHHVSVEIWRLR